MEHDWTNVYERLSTLDAEALVHVAIWYEAEPLTAADQ
jgi:hypothetical protein